ncbi:MAG: hypothetical protein IKF14_01595 [Atopobiaceae bacterium]|nr:hypothetical protein [Atopobiaceae bacterium]
MAGTIQLDYDATLKVARDIESLKDLVTDAYTKAQSSQKRLSSCDGEAVFNAKEAFKRLGKLFEELQGWDTEVAYQFVWAASKMTAADEKAAKDLKASFAP